jgi:alpha-amylase/alpha-mannosidase (GH57 family)
MIDHLVAMAMRLVMGNEEVDERDVVGGRVGNVTVADRADVDAGVAVISREAAVGSALTANGAGQTPAAQSDWQTRTKIGATVAGLINLAIIWHQHQPLYRDLLAPARGSIRMPWVRLHAIRDYFSMARIVSEHPGVHLTINWSPSVLLQIDEYLERGATDTAWELSRVPAERLDGEQKEALLSTFFDADWHNQIFPHRRYRALFERRREGGSFAPQDLRDLQVWFNLAWFGVEMRTGAVALPDGASASVADLVAKGEGFSSHDVELVLAEQLNVMRAIVPEHRRLARAGQIELSATPLFHPILPLLLDTDAATIDLPGATDPPRFAHPEDADAHVARAVQEFERWFGARPRGAWPAEGAVSRDVVPIFARRGIRWIASDQGVLARSGKWGYEAQRSEVRHRCYQSESGGAAISILFRDTELSDDIGFRCQLGEPEASARGWVEKLKQRVARGPSDGDAIVTVVLDGENAWSAYRDDGRPFLHALYAALEADGEIRAVTPSEFIDGNPERAVANHPLAEQARVYELFTGSWIDEAGSAPGVDLGTWIGEPEENAGWALLGDARRDLADALDLAAPAEAPRFLGSLALMAAEGSDWFWWFGGDQDSGHDPDFDELFRHHVGTAYAALGRVVPDAVRVPIVPRVPIWTFARPVDEIFVGDALVVRTNCPGVVAWVLTPTGASGELALAAVGGVMAGARRHQARLGPFLCEGVLVFRFECRHPGCDCREDDACCRAEEARVTIQRLPDRDGDGHIT